MEYISQGIFDYFEFLYKNKKLQNSHANKVHNPIHQSFCFSLLPYHFLNPNKDFINGDRYFFDGLKFKEHHFSVEKNQEFNSNIHYTCTFEKTFKNTELLKISVFFHAKNFKKITRISYRYNNNDNLKKGEIPLNSSTSTDVFQLIFKTKSCSNENFTLEQLLDNASKALMNSRLGEHIRDYDDIIMPKLNDFHAYYLEYQNVYDSFKGSKFLNLAYGQKALALLEEAILIIKDFDSLVNFKKTKDELKKLNSEVAFTFVDNLQAFKVAYPIENDHILVQYFLSKDIKPADDLNQQIQSIYESAMMSGALDLVQYIYEHFYLNSGQEALCDKLLNSIEVSNNQQGLQQKCIDVSNFLFHHSLHHRKAVMSRLGLCEKPTKFHLDVLTQMSLDDNFLGFLMYVNYAKLFPQFNWDKAITSLVINASKDPYTKALNDARTPKP